MSELSIQTAYEGAVGPQKAAVKPEARAVSGGNESLSAGKKLIADVSNYVTSPKGVVDPQSGVYVLQYRDGATGEVLNQYPSAKVVDAYKRGARSGEAASAPVASVVSAQSRSVEGVEKAVVSAPSAPVFSSGPSVALGTPSVGGQGLTPPTSTSIDA